MRKTIFVLLLAVALVISASSVAFAGGDKVRGDKGQGEVNQVQVEDPFPFQ